VSEHERRERHGNQEGFQRPRRRIDNETPDFALQNIVEPLGDRLKMPIVWIGLPLLMTSKDFRENACGSRRKTTSRSAGLRPK
jgi:hypothetical protein